MKTNLKFLNELYTIKDVQQDPANRKTTVQVELNASHSLFQGHFPGNPILPGVCTVQIVKELLSEQLKKEVQLKKASTIKYLSFINPEVNKQVYFELLLKDTEEGTMLCNATVSYEGRVFCSFKGEWVVGAS